MSNIQAAIGCAQMERIEELIKGKRRVFEFYFDAFIGKPVAMNPEPMSTVNGYWMPTILVNQEIPFKRDLILSDLKSGNIDGRVFFWPLSTLGVIDCTNENPIGKSIYRRALNLPSYHDLTRNEIDRVADIVNFHLTN